MDEEDVLPEAVAAPLVVEFTEEEIEGPVTDPLSSAEPRPEIELPRGKPTPANRGRVVTVMNQKGGVGKTTTVINVATHLALHGIRVLVVDCDQQGNCATGLGIDKSRVKHTTRTLFTDPEQAPSCRHATAVPGLHLIVGERSLVGLEQELSTRLGRERCLSEGLESKGCILKGIKYGLVDFLSLRGGKDIYLCWKIPEQRIEYWHDLQSGFAGRQRI